MGSTTTPDTTNTDDNKSNNTDDPKAMPNLESGASIEPQQHLVQPTITHVFDKISEELVERDKLINESGYLYQKLLIF